jgi:nitrate/nitrite transport system ATP-binding protein
VFQAPSLFHWMTALENVVIGVEQVHPSKSRAQHEEIAKHYLALVGLDDSFDKRPPELSSGMRQRVGLARAFALTPRVLLLDEPFGMLDSLTRMELQEVLLSLWRQDRKTALMVTHDVDEALFLSDRVVMMTQGPEAKIGDAIRVPFKRPRDRLACMDDPHYYELRERIIGFLEKNEPHSATKSARIETAVANASVVEVPA